ncbi:MAG TPA: hypothetical protein V6D10_17590 [Trichocoleus sp.]|jgi:hypothetical protein
MQYIISSYRVAKTAADLVDEWLRSLNEETRHFFVHVLHYSINHRPEQGEYCPVPAKLMQKTWGSKCKVLWEVLVERGLIEVKDLGEGKNYSKVAGLCREFKVVDARVDKFLDVESNAVDEEGFEAINLVNNRKMAKYARHELKTVNGVAIPELVSNSMKSVKRCVINLQEAESYLSDLEADIILGSATERDAKIFRINRAAIITVKKSNLKKLEGGLAEYEPAYRMQSTGRITEKGVGMQNCTREMKYRAFSGILRLFNYDLKSSQVWGLIQWFEEAGLNTQWLVEYLNQDKKVYADTIGISKDCWKKCFVALIMGGNSLRKAELEDLRNATTDKEVKEAIRHKIVEYLLKEADGDVEKMLEFSTKFDEVTSALQTELAKWHSWLIEVHPKKMGVSSYAKGTQYLTNGCGAKFNLSEWKDSKGNWVNKAKLGMKLAAFWLQGTEAAFIHHLAIVSAEYGFEVINNQHDGLVTIGEIPEEAVEYARNASGLKYANLEIKSFV